MKLNPQQQQAVEYVSGPCLVLAGAGSGKTRVIINKIAHLIDKCGYLPKQIAAVTFTNKAAREMKERVAQSIGKAQSKGLIVSTFHTLGFDIIKREYKHLGFKANMTLFDEHDQMALLKELTADVLQEDKDLLRELINRISNWKNDLCSPQQALGLARDNKEQTFAHCYDRYNKQLRAYNALDFDDLIMLPTLLFKQNAEVRSKWQEKIRYLLVDEYQDTNTSQYELIKLLVGDRARFTVVGDDDQSIYSWRGARPQNMVRLRDDFPALRVIKLEQNYRSSQRILHCANILIDNNEHVFDKKLFSNLGEGEKLQIIEAKNEEHEAERVVGELIAHRFIGKTHYRDYAILYRGNHQSRLLEKILMQNRIPYKISGGTSFFSRAEIKDMMAYLRLVVNQDDDAAFLRIVNTPKREIGTTTLEKLGSLAQEKHISLFEAIFDFELIQRVTPKAYDALQKFARWIVELNDEIQRFEPERAVRSMLSSLHYEEYLYEYATSPKAAEMQSKNVATLFDWVAGMLKGDEFNEPMNLNQIVTRLTLRDMLERGEEEDDGDQVQLMTLHASKGLEFPHVFLIGMEEGILPHQTSIDEDNVEEERRLAYVGITRAQQNLWFSLCKERRQFGELIRPEPSRFLLELPENDLQWERDKPPLSAEQQQAKTQSHIANLRAILRGK
ncbi:ATP-dependent DNA helicase Rep [Aggregatibacter actinomycetemcomitans serotype e str. SC1083]|uniref:ATP-dependent DNA helicase Rep n=1 Tax=Aggregatibacter actinomycetemcomitans serotype e str. SC1083 TaxID=907488 RepID=G4A8W6_AGGAC|nr:DNA helicase Rep [Aggregatibacter actinomycetemcomitans]EGY33705.1 ATP-dependent DNA helicase Rep [Aggregatibacter actinomycetemcomitans serotype e str. SC1083]KYK76313.1 ATP-dependent DNA helicase Rep [Aggregatibacter actinomycetemcomitans serotype e str. SA3096]KYK77542.1 ATP-dependent DNA helicase Rep [Aggregatibacter actinomycetemcomitans serotype e str. SC936]KYK95832.1 ATP-dependent DNA helicase Rep [Aggregatibacter actinomycetemcomitans serotype e str. ANH9776]TYB21239.1 DNA helicase